MNDLEGMERLVAEFQTATEAVSDPPPGDVDAVVRRGRKRRVLHRAGAMGVGVALLALAAGVTVSSLHLAGEAEVTAPEVEDVDPPLGDNGPERPSPETDDASDEADCSAATMDADLPSQDLPPSVAEVREQIAEAAVACDYERLEALAATTSEFVYSFGGGDDPAGHWQQQEANGEGLLADLVTLLELGHGVTDPGDVAGEVYVWPEVFAVDDPLREDFDPVVDAGLYTEDDVDRWLIVTGAYGGYRVGIDEAGQWRFFVAGD